MSVLSSKYRLWVALPLLGALVIGVFLGSLLAVTQDLPQVESLQTYEPSSVTRILADDGRPVRSFFVERRIPISLRDIPENLIQAVIAVEGRLGSRSATALRMRNCEIRFRASPNAKLPLSSAVVWPRK